MYLLANLFILRNKAECKMLGVILHGTISEDYFPPFAFLSCSNDLQGTYVITFLMSLKSCK